MNFVCDGCCAIAPPSTQLISATASDQATPDSDATSPVTFSQLLHLVKSLSDAVAGLNEQVQLLVARQDSTPRLSSPSINGNGVQREQLFVELREFDGRKKRKDSLIVRGLRVNSNDIFLSRFSVVCIFIIGNVSTPDNFHCFQQG